jgi:hypothetical protein
MFQNGEWPWWDDSEGDAEQEAREQQSRQELVTVLRSTGEQMIELYGVWDGNADFPLPPLKKEEIAGTDLLNRSFRFKQQGFYLVQTEGPSKAL